MISLLQDGKGTFYIDDVSERDKNGKILKTKAGDRKVMVIIKVVDKDGKEGKVFEHLTTNAQWKIESMYKACGEIGLYIPNEEVLDRMAHLTGCSGECVLGTQEPQNGYSARTIIKKYLPPIHTPLEKKPHAHYAEQAIANKQIADEFDDDDIPF